jgi:hypothetical protein
MEEARSELKAKAITFMEGHPTMTYRDALAEVSKPQTVAVPNARSILRDKALKFQETHQGMAYRDALTAVARDPAAGKKELKTPDGQMREALSEDAHAYSAKRGVSFSEALAAVSKLAREKGLIA